MSRKAGRGMSESNDFPSERVIGVSERRCRAGSESLVESSGTAEQGGRGGGAGGTCSPQYFKNYRELVRKSVLCPPNIESLMVPPNLKVAPRSLVFVFTELLRLLQIT